MPTGKKKTRKSSPLSRDRILAAAAEMADAEGLEALSMRKLGQRLGVEAMSLYNHVANKDEILDGLIEIVVGEIELPAVGDDWRTGMRRRAVSARAMFHRHPWALQLMESRTNPGPVAMRYYDAVIGCLRRAGFTVPQAAHAFAVLDSFIYGFCLQEQSLPFKDHTELTALADDILAQLPREDFPHLTEMIVEHQMKPGYTFAAEFDFGLDLVLDGLERLVQTPPR